MRRTNYLLLALMAACAAPGVLAQTNSPGLGSAPPGTRMGTLRLSAVFSNSQAPIRSGVSWRIYADQADGTQTLAAKSSEAAPFFSLPTGTYSVHAAYGFASAIK